MRTYLALAAVCLLAVLSCTAADEPVMVELEAYDVELEAYVSAEVETAAVDEEGTKAYPETYRKKGWRKHVNKTCSLNYKKSKHCPPVVRCNNDDKTCCPVAASVNCRALLRDFGARDTARDALIMATLVGDLSKLVDISKSSTSKSTIPTRICDVKQKWQQYGAQMDTIKIYQFPGSDGGSTFAGVFEADGTTFLVFSWDLGFGQSTDEKGTLPYKGREDVRVWEPFYTYYLNVEKCGILDYARRLGNDQYVLAGLSAGAALSQFAALDLTGVTGVYLYGVEKIGFSRFQNLYTDRRGDVTHAWWNKLDGFPLVPASSQTLANTFGPGLPKWVDPRFMQLPTNLWWRIVPGFTGPASCQRMTAATSGPCPNSSTCTPNTIDHSYTQYFNNIKNCVDPQSQCVSTLAIIA